MLVRFAWAHDGIPDKLRFQTKKLLIFRAFSASRYFLIGTCASQTQPRLKSFQRFAPRNAQTPNAEPQTPNAFPPRPFPQRTLDYAGS